MLNIGAQQSPVLLLTGQALPLERPTDLFRIDYQSGMHHGVFIGVHPSHGNFQFDRPPYPTVSFRGDLYELRCIHIHRGSEHMIDTAGQRDYEVHLVHVRKGMTIADPKLAIGILYHETARGASGGGLEQFNDILRQLRHEATSVWKLKADDPGREACIDPLIFFPKQSDGTPDLTNWFHYEGSLTSEPYSEDVSWFVMRTESGIDPSNLNELEHYAEQEARPTYPLERRIVVRSFA